MCFDTRYMETVNEFEIYKNWSISMGSSYQACVQFRFKRLRETGPILLISDLKSIATPLCG